MALIPKFLRPKGTIRAQAIVVDLANIRVPVTEDSKVVVNGKPQDPFLFEYIDHIKRDIDNLGLGVPVFYLLDTLVKPHEMTAEENEEFLARQTNSIFADGHIWRIGRTHQKADFAICQLVNELGALVISGDRFREYKADGRIEHPGNMLQFAPQRVSRHDTHAFINKGHGSKRAEPAHLIDPPISEAEYWLRWRAHVDVILQWVDPVVAQFAEAELNDFEFPELEAPDSVVDIEEPIATIGRGVPLTAIPRRPSEMPSVLSGDYWGLTASTNQWVKVVGRMFQDSDGWVLRDLASARGVSLPGLSPNRSSRPTIGGWSASTGVLRSDSEGFFLESAELAPSGRLDDVRSLFSVRFESQQRDYTPWGPAPWQRPRPTEEPPLVSLEHPEVALSGDSVHKTEMSDDAHVVQRHDGIVDNENTEDESIVDNRENPDMADEEAIEAPGAVPTGFSSTSPPAPPPEEPPAPATYDFSGISTETPHVVTGTRDGVTASDVPTGSRTRSLVLLAITLALATAAVIIIVL